MSRMEMIHDQREQLQKKLDEYTPKAKEEIIPWADAADSLERLYTDLGQWSQTIEDLEELKNEKTQWRSEFSRLGYTLPLWDRMISPNEEFSAVNWEDGRKLAQSVTVRDNELHFWEQREPEVEELDLDLDGEEAPKQTEEEWHAFEEKANQAEALLHSEMDLQEELDALTQKEDTRYTVWFWLGIAGLAAAVGGMAAFTWRLPDLLLCTGQPAEPCWRSLAFGPTAMLHIKKRNSWKSFRPRRRSLPDSGRHCLKIFRLPCRKRKKTCRYFTMRCSRNGPNFIKHRRRHRRSPGKWNLSSVRKMNTKMGRRRGFSAGGETARRGGLGKMAGRESSAENRSGQSECAAGGMAEALCCTGRWENPGGAHRKNAGKAGCFRAPGPVHHPSVGHDTGGNAGDHCRYL